MLRIHTSSKDKRYRSDVWHLPLASKPLHASLHVRCSCLRYCLRLQAGQLSVASAVGARHDCLDDGVQVRALRAAHQVCT